MRVLIVPDIHHKVDRVDQFISVVGPEKIIFLGDYFDDFYDTPDDMEKTCKWLRNSFAQKNRIHLMGNHDLPYFSRSPDLFACSGYERNKQYVFDRYFSKEDLVKLQFHYHQDKYLITHAGLSKDCLQSFLDGEEHSRKGIFSLGYLIDTRLTIHVLEFYKSLLEKSSVCNSWLAFCGPERYGRDPFGGPLWCDINAFKPIPKIKQIFGHTPHRNPIEIHKNNWCLDTHMAHAAILENGKLEIINYSDC